MAPGYPNIDVLATTTPPPVWWWLVPAAGVFVLVIAWRFDRWIRSQDEGTEAMRDRPVGAGRCGGGHAIDTGGDYGRGRPSV